MGISLPTRLLDDRFLVDEVLGRVAAVGASADREPLTREQLVDAITVDDVEVVRDGPLR
jgi:hypothetical protein